MKKLVSVALVFTLALSLITGCSSKASSKDSSRKRDSDETETEATEEITIPEFEDDDIVFIRQDSNYAWGYYYSLTVYTADGHSYYLDFSGDADTDYSLEDAFSTTLTNGTQEFTPDQMEAMIRMYYSMESYNQTIYDYAMDYGMKSVYFVSYDENGNHEFNLIGAFGDTCYEPNDTYGVQICNRLGINWD